MMVEQKFPLSGNQLMQCHSAKILLVMLPASFRLHQWTYDEKSHYIEVVQQGAIFDGTEYEILAGNWVSFYRKKRPIIGSLEEHYPLSAVTSMNSATVNLWLVFSMKRLTQLPDSDCEQSHYIEIMQAAIFVFFVTSVTSVISISISISGSFFQVSWNRYHIVRIRGHWRKICQLNKQTNKQTNKQNR